MTSTPPPVGPRRGASARSQRSRTTLVTAAAIAGVLLAGTAAVAANMGILDAADNSAIGELAATDELLPTPAEAAAMQASGAAQQYDIDGTGTVWVLTTTSGIALDHLDLGPGWASALSQNDPRSLRIDFTNAGRTITFTASLGDDGNVVVDVTEPVTTVQQAPAGSSGSASAVTPPAGAVTDAQYDDDHDDDQYDDHDDEYEGADDDD